MDIAEGHPCPLCEAPLAARKLAEASGDEAPMRLTLRWLPVLACAAPHRYFVEQPFPMWLLNAMLGEELAKIPAGTQGGLVFRKYRCGGCGGPLPASAGERRTYASHLAWKGGPEFAVEVSMPVCRCPGCGREQVRSAAELAKLLPAALVHAFKAAGMKAPG